LTRPPCLPTGEKAIFPGDLPLPVFETSFQYCSKPYRSSPVKLCPRLPLVASAVSVIVHESVPICVVVEVPSSELPFSVSV
jgi:hypothetical protein